MPRAGQADPLAYFPSAQLGEDDGVKGEYYLEGEACDFRLTHYQQIGRAHV